MRKGKAAAVCAAIVLAACLAGCGNTSDAGGTPAYEVTAVDFSQGLDGNGYIAGVNAEDYITLPDDYDRIPVDGQSATPDESEIDNAVNNLLYGYRTEVPVTDRAVEDGDEVDIDFVGYLNGKPVKHADTEGKGTRVVAGGDGYIGDFLTQLIGHRPGETFSITVTYPDDYENDKSLSGKDVTFSVTVHDIVTYETPEFTDAFVAENLYKDYGCSTVEEARQLLIDGCRREKLSSYFLDYLEKNCSYEELPETYVQIQMMHACQSAINSAVNSRYALSDCLSRNGFENLDAMKESYRGSAESSTLEYLIIQDVAGKAGIEVTGDDLKEQADLVKSYGKGYVAHLLLQDKVQDYLLNHAVYS